MSLALTSPGVYIQELPRGDRSIVGVSTSLTAFVGRTRRGPVETPTRVFSFDEFERRFGGLWTESPLSQALRQYFTNGGREALIVRVVNNDTVGGNAATTASVLLPAQSARLTIRVPAEAMSAPNLSYFQLVISAATGTEFTLTMTARTEADAAIPDYTATATVDLADGEVIVRGEIDSAETTHLDPTQRVKLMEVVGDLPTTIVSNQTTRSYVDAGVHYTTVSALASAMTLEAAGGVPVGTDRVHVVVTHQTDPDLFDARISAVDGSGVELGAYDVTGIDVSGADVATDLAGGLAYVSVAGAAVTDRPSEGLYVSTDVGGTQTLILGQGLRLAATSPGAWGNGIDAAVTVLDADPDAVHLQIRELDASGATVAEELFHNVSVDPTHPRAVDRVLAAESALAEVSGPLPATVPAFAFPPTPLNGGLDGAAVRIADLRGSEAAKSGIHALRDADLFNILCIPLESWVAGDAATEALWSDAHQLCESLRAFLLIDPPNWSDPAAATGSFAPRGPNAALYFPRLRAPDPLQQNRLREFPPCGAVAGVMARTDVERGVWKAPAGTQSSLLGVPELAIPMTDQEQGVLNAIGINCLRTFPIYGSVVWGARTLDGADVQGSQWKYVPIRRLALYLEETLFRSTRWAVFEPNDEPLWAALRKSIGAFMHGLFRQGAFAGGSARKAYFVRCDSSTTPQSDIDKGIVNVIIGFAPLSPAEFVIIKLQQQTQRSE